MSQEYTVTITDEGDTCWYQNGVLHRLDGPAVEYTSGTKRWYQKGLLHREDGPAVEFSDNYVEYWVNGKLHNVDGPAVTYHNGKDYWVNGKLHRLDGPAREFTTGRNEWYIDGNRLTKQAFIKATQPTKELTIQEIEDLLGYKIQLK